MSNLADSDLDSVAGGMKEQSMLFIYTVGNGENASKIAAKFSVPLTEIERLNQAVDLKNLKVGDRVLLPIR